MSPSGSGSDTDDDGSSASGGSVASKASGASVTSAASHSSRRSGGSSASRASRQSGGSSASQPPPPPRVTGPIEILVSNSIEHMNPNPFLSFSGEEWNDFLHECQHVFDLVARISGNTGVVEKEELVP